MQLHAQRGTGRSRKVLLDLLNDWAAEKPGVATRRFFCHNGPHKEYYLRMVGDMAEERGWGDSFRQDYRDGRFQFMPKERAQRDEHVFAGYRGHKVYWDHP